MLNAEWYRLAYAEVERWEKMNAEQRKKSTPPSGPWADRVADNRARFLRGEMDTHDAARRAAGMI